MFVIYIQIAAFLDPNEYYRLQQRPVELEAAITLLKIEMEKDAERISRNLDPAHSANGVVCDLNSINLSSTNTKQNNIDSLFNLCGIEPSVVLTPSLKKAWSIDEEIGYYIFSINTEQVKFSAFWSSQEERLPIMSSVVRRISIIPASSVPCESTFSIAGYIRRKERCSWSPRAIRYSLVLKDRHKLSCFKN